MILAVSLPEQPARFLMRVLMQHFWFSAVYMAEMFKKEKTE